MENRQMPGEEHRLSGTQTTGGKKKFPDVRNMIRRLPWKRILIGTGAAAAVFLLAFLALVWHLAATAPDIDTICVSPTESATYICDQDGNYLRKLTLAGSNRDIVTLDEIPDSLQKAMIAIEDERFYEHGGIDLHGIARAFLTGIANGSFSEGASTITQQLIKNSVFTDWTQESSFTERFRRKVQEQYLALQLEDRISKDEILEDYLNTINLGAGCYGVQSAARRYFGKDVSELSVSESAVLAAIPQNPSRYNPITNPEENSARRAVVLRYMTEQGYLSESERETALSDDVYARVQAFDATYDDSEIYSYYEDALIEQAIDALTEKKGYSPEQAYRAVYSGGLRIFSAQDASLQQICDEEFSDPANFPEGTEFGIDYALSVSDADGQVAHYGSESLRSFVRENLDSSFDLLCASRDEAQGYADAFREYILETTATNTPEDDSNGNTSEKSGEDSENNSDGDSDKDSNGNAAENSGEDSENNGATVLGERLTLSPQPQASLVLIDQSTGLVRALVGGRGEKTASLTLNRATETTRQPGSTFKILTAYAPAIDAFGKTLATLYQNEHYKYEDGTPVSNWDITDYSGTVTIREAILRSINVIAVKCITEISPRVGYEYARKLGISTLQESYTSADGSHSSDIVQPLALGGITQGVTNLELCAAYAAIANQGVYRTPKFFTKILDRQGNVLIDQTDALTEPVNSSTAAKTTSAARLAPGETQKDNTRVLSESTAFLLTDAMKDVVNAPDGTAYGAITAGTQPVAGKTGTTSNYKDIWFVGYTPFYTCCVWGGYDNNRDLPLASTYHTYNKVLWSAVMNRVHEGIATSDFPIPRTVEPVTLCRESHLPAVPGGCMETYVEYFAVGTEPQKTCSLHKPAPETEKETIYPDLFRQLRKKAKEQNESESESESESETESELKNKLESESESALKDKGDLKNKLESESEDTMELNNKLMLENQSKNVSESESELEQKSAPESENEINTESKDQAEQDSEDKTAPDSEHKTEPDSREDAESDSGAASESAQNESDQPDTSSFDDLLNRLTGSSMNPGNAFP